MALTHIITPPPLACLARRAEAQAFSPKLLADDMPSVREACRTERPLLLQHYACGEPGEPRFDDLDALHRQASTVLLRALYDSKNVNDIRRGGVGWDESS